MGAVSARAVRTVDPPAKLALLERLLVVEEVSECVERVVTWLGSNTHTQQAICALVDRNTGQLTGVAGHHVSASQIEKVSVGLDED